MRSTTKLKMTKEAIIQKLEEQLPFAVEHDRKVLAAHYARNAEIAAARRAQILENLQALSDDKLAEMPKYNLDNFLVRGCSEATSCPMSREKMILGQLKMLRFDTRKTMIVEPYLIDLMSPPAADTLSLC